MTGWNTGILMPPGEQLGKQLGICKNVGAAMTYWILKDNGQVVARSTVRKLNKDEWLDEVEKQAQLDFNKADYEILGNSDDTKILQEPCDEMEELIFADDKEEHNLPDWEQEQKPSETQQPSSWSR